ncbi:TPA: TonB-dependent receptor, partial [Candidatus Poribacteria bacterium]|nr:TonB-dependent receptor [Candidatus Poribacteria bacterium]
MYSLALPYRRHYFMRILKPYCPLFLLLGILLFPHVVLAQKTYTVSGYIKEGETGEDMISATVYIKELLKGTTTNLYGFYSITVPEGNYNLIVSYLGFETITQEIGLTKDLRVNVELKSKMITTEEVVIEAERADKNVGSSTMGTVEMEMEQIQILPALLGEVDILKVIQMLPGVQSAGEGNSGFYVRGGGPDQNLILLDEAVIYNVSHLFGFFSVFNADAVKSIELIKGGMPANYGGRLASVLNVTMKDGNNKKWQVEGGLGVISSKLTIQGPIKKNVSSIILSGRRTYYDLFLPLIAKNNENFKAFEGSGYYFYDLNTKINYKISDKDRIFLSGYFGRDVFTYKQAQSNFTVQVPWGNATMSLRWNHLFNDKLFMNTSLIFSDYKFSLGIIQNEFEMKLFSGIRDYNAKLDFNYYPVIRHNIKFGANYIYHVFTPSSASASQGDVEFDTGDIIRQYAHEGALYFNDQFDWTDKFQINAGLRYSIFSHTGPFTRYNKDTQGNGTDTITYKKNETIKTYQGLEPRVTLRYQLNTKSSVKASYTLNNQYVHMTTLAGMSLPTDVWIGCSDLVKPQLGTQYAVGYFRNFLDNQYETSVEVYYKTMKNMIEFKDGHLPGDNVADNPDNNLTFGEGESYGVELFIKKRMGDLTGWIGYTLARTTRTFEEINNGEPFPTRYDRRHDLAVVAAYEIEKKGKKEVSDSLKFFKRNMKKWGNWFRTRTWVFAGNFVYATGDAITLPVARYMYEGNILNEYGPRNSFRMKDYHRADISVTVMGRKRKRIQSVFSL